MSKNNCYAEGIKMAREFNKNIGAQREKFKVTEEALMDRIESAPFGEKTKELAKNTNNPLEQINVVCTIAPAHR